jgi:hypothetical protein
VEADGNRVGSTLRPFRNTSGFGPDGKRIRRKVTGRTKAEVRDKLKAANAELYRGRRAASRTICSTARGVSAPN